MRVVVLAVGKIKSKAISELCDDYATRVARYARFEAIELKEGAPPELVAKVKNAISTRAHLVALEAHGQHWTSQEFATFVGSCEQRSVQSLVFLIGGSYGLPKEASSLAQTTLSLSPLTFPHRLARVILLEQIYRAFTILRNEPYSH